MKFRARVEPPEPMRGLEVPQEVVEALGGGKRPTVTITINGHSWRSRIAIMRGRYLIGLSKANRQAAGIVTGDEVEVDVQYDPEPRVVAEPADLARALDADLLARTAYNCLPYRLRLQHVRAIETAKKPETRLRRIDKAIAALRGAGRTRAMLPVTGPAPRSVPGRVVTAGPAPAAKTARGGPPTLRASTRTGHLLRFPPRLHQIGRSRSPGHAPIASRTAGGRCRACRRVRAVIRGVGGPLSSPGTDLRRFPADQVALHRRKVSLAVRSVADPASSFDPLGPHRRRGVDAHQPGQARPEVGEPVRARS
jgi:Domain of unknown function (DUF1905)/Bacteriocin-protection, YdeI or OmpD-Associated